LPGWDRATRSGESLDDAALLGQRRHQHCAVGILGYRDHGVTGDLTDLPHVHPGAVHCEHRRRQWLPLGGGQPGQHPAVGVRRTIDELDNPPPDVVLLSAPELEVLKLTSLAMSNAQIGRQLAIAVGTVKRHLTNIYSKLGAVSRVDAIRKATVACLIPTIDAENGTIVELRGPG
jgi:DNA-binding CsgD family transcriptional regulator